jgi:hydroxyacylglutathione hydrolase
MRVVTVPCLSDNYAYLLIADGSSRAVVVDPSEAAPVIAAIEREQLELVAILNTHHHWDHVGGNVELRKRYGQLPVYAHASDRGRVPEQTDAVEEGVPFSVAGLDFTALHVPGHTLGAVSYVTEGAVFTGDTLFVAGCGRLFEGTAEQMYVSLVEKLGKLPAETRVYCGHEYTVANLRFAAFAEPDNDAARAKLEQARSTRARNEPTVPSTIGDELAVNPFMRSNQPSLQRRFAGNSPAEVLGAVRKAKDTFK